MGHIQDSHIHWSPQTVVCSHHKGKDVGTEMLFSLQAGSWIFTTRSEVPQPTQIQSKDTEEAQPIQRSTRQGKPVSRLLEDPSWP